MSIDFDEQNKENKGKCDVHARVFLGLLSSHNFINHSYKVDGP